MAEPSEQPTDSLDREEGPIPGENVQRQQEESPPLTPVRTPILLSTAIMGESSASSATFPRVIVASTTPNNSSLNDYDSIRTRYPRRGDSSSSSMGGYYQQPPSALRGCRRLLRCVCFPIVVLTTLLAICLFFLFIGVPFLLLMIGLLVAYYCCTSNPIPFRTLLRAMLGVDDWNGGVFDGSTNNHEPYNVTKEDIRKNIIRRLCLGPMEWKVVRTENSVGGDLSTLPRDHPGRVHWRNETSSEKILVFSAPLRDAATSSSIQEDADVVDDNKGEVNTTSTTLSTSEMLQGDESLHARNKIPKYLQHHKEKENDKNEEEKEEEKDNPKLNDKEKTDFDPKISEELPVEPVHDTAEVSPSVRDDPAAVLDDHSSVRDRGAVCDICLLEFETGEAVAWSPNPACNHAYHEDCITDWLLRKPTCPSCRQNYIVLPVIRQSGSDSSGVVDHTSSGEVDDDAVESSILRELANIDDSSSTISESSAQIQTLDGLQPPTAANAEGDIEMGITGTVSSSPTENFENY